MVAQDIAPYTLAQGDRARLIGLNLTGLKRRGFSPEAISAIKKAYRLVFRSGLKFEEAKAKAAAECGDLPEVVTFMEFLASSNVITSYSIHYTKLYDQSHGLTMIVVTHNERNNFV